MRSVRAPAVASASAVAHWEQNFASASFSWPQFDWPNISSLLFGPAFTIALLGSIESLLCARVADAVIEDRHDPNQELMAQGIANIVSPVLQVIAPHLAARLSGGGTLLVAGISETAEAATRDAFARVRLSVLDRTELVAKLVGVPDGAFTRLVCDLVSLLQHGDQRSPGLIGRILMRSVLWHELANLLGHIT